MHSTVTGSGFWPQLDRYAIGLSGLCMVHCFGTTVLLALAASAGGLLLHPLFHEIGLGLAILMGGLALIRGVLIHGYFMPIGVGSVGLGVMIGALTLPHSGGETLWTLVGVGLLALGHDLNQRATH